MENNNIKAAILNSFKGVEIKQVPKVGGGWSFPSGSDSYGGKILYVSPDLSWFIGDGMCGFAKFETRKNTTHFGRYVHASYNGMEHCIENFIQHPENFNSCYKEVYKSLKMEKTCHNVRCSHHNVRYVSDKPQTTYYDPSF